MYYGLWQFQILWNSYSDKYLHKVWGLYWNHHVGWLIFSWLSFCRGYIFHNMHIVIVYFTQMIGIKRGHVADKIQGPTVRVKVTFTCFTGCIFHDISHKLSHLPSRSRSHVAFKGRISFGLCLSWYLCYHLDKYIAQIVSSMARPVLNRIHAPVIVMVKITGGLPVTVEKFCI